MTSTASMNKAATTAEPATSVAALNDLYLAAEAPKGVNLVVRNSSSGSPLTDAELKASLYNNGLIHPLIFKMVDDKRYVVAGNRRLKMLREIFAGAETSKLAQLVKVQNVDDYEGDWRQIAIDSNLSLPPHIVERYEQIVLLAKDLKLSPEDVQARFGLTARQYNQVMALGRMSPLIRQLWKDSEIDAKTAQAFTLEPDPKEQDRIYAAVKKTAWRGVVESSDVQSKILPPNQREVGRLVAFIGIDTVRKAKLLKTEDLFSTSHTVTDAKTLKKMAETKINEECRRLVVDSGWSWAIPEDQATKTYEYGTIEPAKKSMPTDEENREIARLDRIVNSSGDDDGSSDAENEMDKLQGLIKDRGYTPEQRKKAGCFVKIGGDGSLVIDYGRVKPAERKAVQATERKAAKAKAAPKKPGVVTLTNALAERLSQQLEKALSAALHARPDVAVAALIAAFASRGHILDVAVANESRHSYGKSSSDKNFAQAFEGAVKTTAESRVIMLTKVAAAAFSIQIHNADAKSPIADVGLQALVAKMDGKFLNSAISNEFDANDYFASVNLQACVDAVRSAMGDEHADKVAKMKKGDAAKFAAANVIAKGWLPKELRTVHYKGPGDAASPKAAPTKKAAKKGKK